MRNTIFILILTTLILISGSCKTTQAPVNITNLNKALGLMQYSNMYALPKTVVKVKVTVEKLSYFKGPYYQYAQFYLGLNDVIQEDSHKWRIAKVEFETYPIADTNNVYLIECSPEFEPLQMRMDNFGFLESINDFNYRELKNKEIVVKSKIDVDDQQLQPEKSFSFDDIQLPKVVFSKKTIGEQAGLLANHILTLRDDRAAILVGDGYTNALPSGETFKEMISRIDEMHDQYMAMFKGMTSREIQTFSFDFVPEEPRKTTQAILFRFSENEGVVDNSNIYGIPVIIEIESFENLKQLEQFKKRKFYLEKVANKTESDKGLYFRVPEMGVVRLLKNEKILAQEKIQIAQYGSVQSLPFAYLNGNYAISFYPELGLIKSISLNEKGRAAETSKKKK